MRKLCLAVLGATLVASVASAASDGIGQMGVFYANVGWIGQAAATTAGDEIIADVTSFDEVQSYDLNGTEDWVIANTGDGDVDCLVLFGYTPETIYAPGNADADDSPLEQFIDDGNFVMNTADYIFYVTAGGGERRRGRQDDYGRQSRPVDGQQRDRPHGRRREVHAEPRFLQLQPVVQDRTG